MRDTPNCTQEWIVTTDPTRNVPRGHGKAAVAQNRSVKHTGSSWIPPKFVEQKLLCKQLSRLGENSVSCAAQLALVKRNVLRFCRPVSNEAARLAQSSLERRLRRSARKMRDLTQ